MSNVHASPFEEGEIAAAEGDTIESNPYKQGTEGHDLWREGYNSGLQPGDELGIPDDG